MTCPHCAHDARHADIYGCTQPVHVRDGDGSKTELCGCLGLPGGVHAEYDAVNHPTHYTKHPSGVECIQITEHMNFNVGNAVKYLWRADLKNGLEDLEKARWYVDREIARQKAAKATRARSPSLRASRASRTAKNALL